MNNRLVALAVAAVLYPSAHAFAQGASEPQDDDKADELQEIVVTATRRELNLQNVPQSITAFSTEDIQKQAFQNIEDVIGALPSVNLVNAMPGRNSVIMRGVSTGSAEYRTDSQVAVYLDDQPLTSISQQVDIQVIDIARIESLPGPQGTLFGSSSQSGTLRYITNKPDATKSSAQLDVEAGKTKGGEGSYDVSGHFNIPIAESLAVRIVGFASHEGGYVDNVLGRTLMGDRDNADVVEKDWNDYDTYGGRVAARWQINPRWETTLSFILQNSRADGSWDSDPYLGDYKLVRFFDEFRNDDWQQESVNIKGDLGFAELSITGSYFDRDIAYTWDNMTYDQWRSFGNPGGFYDTGTSFGTYFNNQGQQRSAYEVRLTSQGESRFQWMAGAFYEDVHDGWDAGTRIEDLDSTPMWALAQGYACAAPPRFNVPCPLPVTDIFYNNIFDKTIRQNAVFGEMTYSLTDRWSVTGGARWFKYDRDELDIYETPKGLPNYAGNAPVGRQQRTGTSSDMVYKFGTEFHFDPDRMVYLLYSEGFRLGGNNGSRAVSTGTLPLEYRPDTLKNYEAGLKSEWLENRLQLNVSLFLMRWSDIQLNESSGSPWWVRGTFNGGSAEQKGVEINGIWKATQNLSFEASMFLADPKFTESTTFPDGAVLRKGMVMPVSPRQKYWAAAEYTVPHLFGLDGDSWARFSYSWQSETWKDVDALIFNERELLIDPWSTSTLQFGFSPDSEEWDIALVVRNLFDEHNVNWLSRNDYGSAFNDPRFQRMRTLQEPRSISVWLTKKW